MADESDLQRSMAAVPKGPTPKKAAPRPPAAPPGGPANVARALTPAAYKRAAAAQPVADTFPYDTALRLAFLGAGQGGGRIANAFWTLGYRRVGIFNTTDADFGGLDPEIPTLSLDIGGAAKDMRLAQQNLTGREEEVRDLMTRAWGNQLDLALVCVGLGGGSGGGTAAMLVALAKKYMEDKGVPARVGAIVSLPNPAEGQQVCRNAVTAFQGLLQAGVSPLIVIDNARINELYDPPMSRLMPTSNEIVSKLLHLFNQLAATRSPHITFDRSEFAQLMDSGIVVMGSTDIDVKTLKSPADVSKAIRDDLANSILAQVNLRTGRKAACLFVADDGILDNLGMDYFDAGWTQLNRMLGADDVAGDGRDPIVVHRGLYLGDEGLQVYTLVGEIAPPTEKLGVLAKVGGLTAPRAAQGMAKKLGVE